MHGTTTTQFNCLDCNALYHLIKVEAGPETVDRELNCRTCGAPLPARDGQFVLKYFLLQKPIDALQAQTYARHVNDAQHWRERVAHLRVEASNHEMAC